MSEAHPQAKTEHLTRSAISSHHDSGSLASGHPHDASTAQDAVPSSDSIRNDDANEAGSTFSSTPTPEHVARRPFPRAPVEGFVAASVEDCPEEDARLPSFTTASPTKACGLPTSSETSEHVRDCSSQILTETIDTPLQKAPPPQIPSRRPNAMEFLVSQEQVPSPSIKSDPNSPSSRKSEKGYAWPKPDRGAQSSNAGSGAFRVRPPGYGGDGVVPPGDWMPQPPALQFIHEPSSFHSVDVPDKASASQPWYHQANHQPWAYRHAPQSPSSTIGHSQSDLRSETYYSPSQPDFVFGSDHTSSSGYQLLATKLSGDIDDQPITPIYRRFDALNHRLLLYMQDEITDLEERLASLESRDTANRSYAGGVMPDSRRQSRWNNDQLAEQKTEVLGLIGYKLSQYNRVLVAFSKTRKLQAPTWRDVQAYKTFLSTSKLIVDDETRFLDYSGDLVSLGSHQSPYSDEFNDARDVPTPVPQTTAKRFHGAYRDVNDGNHIVAPSTSVIRAASGESQEISSVVMAGSGMFVVFVPIFLFVVIPSFLGRMAIVLLVALSVGIMMEQMERRRMDWIAYLGIYCGAMALVAGALRVRVKLSSEASSSMTHGEKSSINRRKAAIIAQMGRPHIVTMDLASSASRSLLPPPQFTSEQLVQSRRPGEMLSPPARMFKYHTASLAASFSRSFAPARPFTHKAPAEPPPWPRCSHPSPYEILGIQPTATYTKRHFYQLVKLYHPDSPSSPLPCAVRLERYRLVVAANDLLSDPQKRRLYDHHGVGWTSPQRTREADHAWRSRPGNASRNATWEDWERWRAGPREPVYMSNGMFAALVVCMCMIGAFAQMNRAEAAGEQYVDFVQHKDWAIGQKMRESTLAATGRSKDERVDTFLKERENLAYDFQPTKFEESSPSSSPPPPPSSRSAD